MKIKINVLYYIRDIVIIMKPQIILAEIIGTFIFFSGLLAIAPFGPFAGAIGLVAGIYLSAKVSGGHLNPAFSIIMAIRGDISITAAIAYISSQIIGGILALLINSYLVAI
jgi:glycerol uptake facilitator-like aquaporin